ncbi:MAG: hypothetical protein OCC49_16190 [Fibrobacterales bacterium]
MQINHELLTEAFLFLKNYAYHENLNFFLKQRVAEFETNDFQERLDYLEHILNSEDIQYETEIDSFISDIDYKLIPKSVYRPEDKQNKKLNGSNQGLFITNVTTSSNYNIDKVNYLISMPVELHIIEVLWSLCVGTILDNNLIDECYGNRLGPDSFKFSSNNDQKSKSRDLFKLYIDQYKKWRDIAVKSALELSKHEPVALLSLDLKSYFYHINIDYQEITNILYQYFGDDSSQLKLVLKLHKTLQIIHEKYAQKIRRSLKTTHPDCLEPTGLPIGLPIGLTSSSILANWHLREFDITVKHAINPIKYGRYVDDILIVYRNVIVDDNAPIEKFIEQYLPNIHQLPGSESEYGLSVKSTIIPLQKSKLILQYFDNNFSKAGLQVFQNNIDERSSAFKFLANDSFESDLDKCAYDILYEGSINKFRSVVGIAENESELSGFLSNHINAHRLCKLDNQKSIVPQLKMFFQGSNAIQFSRLWEKVYQYLVIHSAPDKQANLIEFYNSIQNEIFKIRYFNEKESDHITDRLITNLLEYNKISVSINLALLDYENHDLPNDIFSFTDQIRYSNLIRSNLVAWPLANYTNYEGDLTNEIEYLNSKSAGLDNHKLSMSPRFIHFDEWQTHSLADKVNHTDPLQSWISDSLEEYKVYFPGSLPIKYTSLRKDPKSIKKNLLTISTDSFTTQKVAIANIQVPKEDIQAALRPDKKANTSFERQTKIFNILNDATKEEVDLLILPEVSIPVSWLPFIIAHSRRHQLGIIFGLEHWVSKGYAYNLTIEALPFKINDKYKSCSVTARIKNHYAPMELDTIQSLRLKPASDLFKRSMYHKVKWRGMSFATYNCFELSDIRHRSLFKSELDLLVACVWNPDTNYYKHILESAVRDLHCYVVHSNTSQYGGSCVLQPTKTESKLLIYVKGGENHCILTTQLNIQPLRDFQYLSHQRQDPPFKPLPPGYDCNKVLRR